MLTALVWIGAALLGCDDTGMNTPGSGTATVANQAANEVAGQGSTDAVTLSWEPPTENADGTPLMDLRGYKIHYGSQPGAYADTIDLSNAGLTTYVVQNLSAGTYYFAITTYNAAGVESSLSPEISTLVD